MLERLAGLVVSRRRAVLIAAGIAFLTSGALGGSVAKSLSSGGFNDPAAESSKALRVVERDFHSGQPNLVLLVTARDGSVDDAAVAAAGLRVTQQLASEKTISQAVSYWTLGSPPPLRSKNGTQALVLARIAGTDDQVREAVKVLSPRYTRTDAAVTVRVGGFAEVFRQVGMQIETDLRRAEMIALPITLLLLILVFGSAIASALPLVIGGMAIVGTFLVLRVVASFTHVSIFSLNLTTAMGLGLAIDYSLFVVSRFREELRNGLEPDDAVRRTVKTAGRTVAFSGLTVAASLAALLVFPLAFLRSFAYAGIAVVAIAATSAVVVLPAILATLGTRVDRFVLFRRRSTAGGDGFWHRAAMFVMRRPVAVAGVVVAVLAVLGSPFFHIRFGLPDDRVLPASASSRQVQHDIRTHFSSEESSALAVVASHSGAPASRTGEIDRYAVALSRIHGVARVDAITGSYINGYHVIGSNPSSARFASADGTWLAVVPSVEPMSQAGERLVKAVRALARPFPVIVGGPSAQLVDSKASLFGRIPLAAGLIALITFTILFLSFGSVLVPVKAVVLNLLSLSATFGAMVWLFQEGHLARTLAFTPTGTIDTTSPILMFCIAFGLSMDYEVFLLSRIKEEHDRSGDNVSSVAIGLERTGGIVTAAAALLAVVFIAFATSKVTFIKLFGIGLTVAVLMDATLVRAALVPAFMRLAGDANWWAPAPLRRLYERFGFSETGSGHDAEGAAVFELRQVRPSRVMLEVPMTEFRTKAPEIARRAQADGESFLVTSRGRPVAVVLPYADVDESQLGAKGKAR